MSLALTAWLALDAARTRELLDLVAMAEGTRDRVAACIESVPVIVPVPKEIA